MEFQAKSNRVAHHTDEYENEGLIVRRGQEFKISVAFDRDFDAKQDKVILQFVTGKLHYILFVRKFKKSSHKKSVSVKI